MALDGADLATAIDDAISAVDRPEAADYEDPAAFQAAFETYMEDVKEAQWVALVDYLTTHAEITVAAGIATDGTETTEAGTGTLS